MKPHLTKGGDWSENVYTIGHNDVFVSKAQFNPIQPDAHVYLFDINYFNKVSSDSWYCLMQTTIKCSNFIQKFGSQAPLHYISIFNLCCMGATLYLSITWCILIMLGMYNLILAL